MDGGPASSSDPDGSDQGSADAGDVDEATQFLIDYAAAVCAMYEPCCNVEGLGYDASGCTSWFRRVTAAYFAGEYRPEQGAACLRALADARSADADRCSTVGVFDEATLRSQCREAFVQATRDGEPLGGQCLLAGDCASSPDGPVICSSRRCLLQRRGTAGDGPCYLSGNVIEGVPTEMVRCEDEAGLYCHRGDNVCAPHVADGEYCPYLDACGPNAMCIGGMCRGFPEPGEPCLNAVPGAGGSCGPGSKCDVVTLTCGPQLGEGEPCREPASCASGICLKGVCAKSDFTQNLSCTGE